MGGRVGNKDTHLIGAMPVDKVSASPNSYPAEDDGATRRDSPAEDEGRANEYRRDQRRDDAYAP